MSEAAGQPRYQRGTAVPSGIFPCPFCHATEAECFGEDVEPETERGTYWDWSVKCHNCDARGPKGCSEEEAWSGWGHANRSRSLPVSSELVAACMHLARKAGAAGTWQALSYILDQEPEL